MRMSKRSKRALLNLLKAFQDSDDAPHAATGGAAGVEQAIEQVQAAVGSRPALKLCIVKGLVTTLIDPAAEASGPENERRVRRTYVVLARGDQDAIEQAVNAALEDQTVATAYDGDFVAASQPGPWLASEGGSD